MKSKKPYQRDSAYLFKKRHTARCGFLCCALMMGCAVALIREGNLVDFFLDNSWRIRILGQDGPDEEIFWCDRLHKRTDVCLLRGDVHVIMGNSSSVELHSRSHQEMSNCGRVELIRPYTRKWETQTMASVEPVALECKIMDGKDSRSAAPDGIDPDKWCDVNYSVPAVLFSSGGFTGNPYHDFQDVLIPLFIVSQHLKGEVVFVVSDIRPWWIQRWSSVLHQLSSHPMLDFKENTGDHCFPEVMVGLYIHREFGVSPSLMPNGETMQDFQRLLHNALAIAPPPSNAISDNFYATAPLIRSRRRSRSPKLLIVARTETRVLINLKEVVKLAKELRYSVNVVTLSDKISLQTIYGKDHSYFRTSWKAARTSAGTVLEILSEAPDSKWFHGSDVVMGVHGAELAHMMFMRRKAVVVQIVPLGTDWPAHQYFARPAVRELGLQYIEYKISPEESSLSERYGLWHPIVRNPATYIAKGWPTQKQLYLTEQDVSPSPDILRQTLFTAKSRALSAFP